MRSTMINGNRDGSFTLYCYIGNEVVYERTYDKMEPAREAGMLFLDKKLDVEMAA